MRIVKYFCIFSLIVFFLVGTTLSILITYADTEPLKGYILEKAGNTIGATVFADQLDIHIFSSPHIRLTGVTFLDQQTNARVFQLESGACQFDMSSLMSGHVVINRCTLNEPAITIRQEQDGSWQWLMGPEEEDTGTSLVKFTGVKELGIHNGSLTIIAKLRQEKSRSFTLSRLEATLHAPTDFNELSFRVTAIPSDAPTSSEIAVTGQAQGIRSIASSHSPIQSPSETHLDVTANVHIRDMDIRPILEFVDPTIDISRPHLISDLDTTLTLFSDTTGYTLIAEDASCLIHDFPLHGKMSVTGLSTGQPAFFFTGTVPMYSIENLVQLTPRTWIPDDIHLLLQQHEIRGNFDIPHMTIAGPLDGKTSPSIIGSLHLTHGFVDPHTDIPPLHNIQIAMTLESNHLTINNVSADYQTSHIRQAQGSIHFRTPHPWLTLTVNGDIQAQDALKAARQFGTFAQDPPLWLKAQAVEGHARVGLRIEGAMGGSDHVQVQRGELNIENLGFQLPMQPLPIHAITGKVTFDHDQVTFDTLSAEYGSSTLQQANGHIESRKPGPWLTVTANGNLHARDILTTVRQLDTTKQDQSLWLEMQNVQGNAAFALALKGPLTEPSQLKIHQGELHVRNLGFEHTASPLPLQEFSGHLNFDQEHVTIHTLNGKVGKSDMTLQGSTSFGQEYTLKDVTLQSQVELSDLQLIFPQLSQDNHLSGGPLDITLNISGSTTQPTFQTEIDLTPITISYPHVIHKPSGISTWLKLDSELTPNHKLHIRQSALEIPPFHLKMKGDVSFDDQHIFNVTIATGSKDESFFPEHVVVGDERFKIQHLGANVRLHGSGKDWLAWQTNGIIHINTSQSIAAQTSNDTHQTARVQWTQEHRTATVHVRAHDIPLESIIPDNSKVDGNLSTTVSFTTQLGNAQQLQQDLTGEGDVHIHDGHIIQSPTISRILGLLNLPNVLMGKVNLAQEGIPFHNLTGTFTINNGLMASNDLLLNSPVIKMTAAGTYDLPQDQLDFIVAVSPFGEYSNLLKNIPLFGRILKGERQGLATALFEVKESRSSPKVRYLPLESFAGGLQGLAQFAVDVLKNTVTLPKGLMTEPQEKNTSSQARE
ncbi:MAG: hypothetical protein NPIRA02_19870 [Nitrospirales bacterium]|nr:MAG: hypothetical protein NPIRA02_19870 [Nitrospirales bacterium]